MELMMIYIAIASTVVAVVCTSPSWLVGRLSSLTRPRLSQKVPGLRSSLHRWLLFLVFSSATGVAYVTLFTQPRIWVLALAILGSVGCQFLAFMIGAGARDHKNGFAPPLPDRSHLAVRQLDAMDHELIALTSQK